MSAPAPVLPVVQDISLRIASLRDRRVILDADLAALYGVETKRFNEQVKRNLDRFPADFMFQLDADEHEALRSQFATSNAGRGGRRYRPYAFTEHGAIMAAMILNSPRAVEVSVYVVRAKAWGIPGEHAAQHDSPADSGHPSKKVNSALSQAGSDGFKCSGDALFQCAQSRSMLARCSQ